MGMSISSLVSLGSKLLRLVALAASSMSVLACGSSSGESGAEIRIGLLLPFTGNDSATSANFERAAIFAVDRVNADGGIAGKKLRLISKDTHSDLARSRAALEELLAEGARAVVGPESADIAAAIAPTLNERGVLFVSPLVGAADDALVDCSTPWFRLAPAARSLGEALAKQLIAAGVSSAAIVSEHGAYDRALAAALSKRFTSLGGSVTLSRELPPGAQSYAALLPEIVARNPQGVALATSARSAALLVNEFDSLNRAQHPRWFLSPLLKTELFVQNVPADALEGALGVAPRIYDSSSAFPDAFSQRWSGDLPLEGAYFYYDALAALAFAFATEAHDAPLAGDHGTLSAALFETLDGRGEALHWSELDSGVTRLAAGDDIYYSGLTGPLLVQSCGNRQLGASSTWEVHGGAIVNTQ
jgi:ABC-type branched-subunit amino acid transport system substrate-binding protein